MPLPKSVNGKELCARLEACLRQAPEAARADLYEAAELYVARARTRPHGAPLLRWLLDAIDEGTRP